MTPRKTRPSLAALLTGDELPPKMTQTLRAAGGLDLIVLPQKMADYYRGQGRNLFPAKPHHALAGSLAARGAYALVVEDLPEDERDEMLREARRCGYRVRSDDHTIELGDCVLYTQHESDRAAIEVEEREQFDAQLGGDHDWTEGLNQKLAMEFGSAPLLGMQVGRARDGEMRTIVNTEER